MTCPTCRTDNPEIANFCMICGRQFRARKPAAPADAAAAEDGEWTAPDPPTPTYRTEYADVTIPLNLVHWPPTPERAREVRERYNQLVNEYLASLARDGWLTDDPTDFSFADRTGRMRVRRRDRPFQKGFLGKGAAAIEATYESVTFRVKRQVREEPTAP